MAVPSSSEADAATQRVRLVAEMLRKKASEVQSKGNASAAKSLSDSAVDLQRAAELLHELMRHVHATESQAATATATPAVNGPTRSQDGRAAPNGAQPPASTSVKDLVVKLGRVDAMLGKKSDEMKAKGNDAAANALHQSALAVRVGAQHIAEQQQMTRTLVVTARALREQLREQWRLLLEGEVEISDETALDDELRQRAVAQAKELLAMREVVRSVHPQATTAQALREVLEAPTATAETADRNEEIAQWQEQCDRLQQQISEAQAHHELELRAAQDESANMTNQCAVLEKALGELEAEYHERREREIEHLNALHERQKDTHEELKRVLLAKEEEVSALKVQAESWMNQLSKERDAQTELQTQREEDRKFHERQVSELRDQLQTKNEEILSQKEELRTLLLRVTELEQVQLQQPTEESLVDVEAEQQKRIEELRLQLEDVQRDRDELVDMKNKASRALEAAQAQVIDMTAELEALREGAKKLEDESSVQRQRVGELEAALAEATSESSNVDHGVLENAQAQVVNMTAELEALRKETTHFEAESSAHRQRVVELEAALVEATSKANDTDPDDEKVAADLAELGGMRETISELKSQLNEQQRRREELESVLASTRGALAKRESEVEEHVRRLDEVQTTSAREREELRMEFVQRGHQMTRLQAELKEEREQVTALQESLDGRGSSVDEHSARAQAAEKAMEAKQLELAECNERLVKAQQSIDRLADQLESCSSLSELHQVAESPLLDEGGVDRVLRALQKHVTISNDTIYSEAASVKVELVALLRSLNEHDSSVEGDAALPSIVQSVHERVLRLVSEMKSMRSELSHTVSRQQEQVEMARRGARDELVTQHESQCEELRAEIKKLSSEKSDLDAKLRKAEADRATSSANGEDETQSLKTKLADVENEFERYRTRSHAALKKVEKRAELLNGMRKENEALMQEVAKLKESHAAAVEKEAAVRKELEKITTILRQREEADASQAEEAAASVQQLKIQCAALEKEKEALETALRSAEAKTAELQEEKEALATTKDELHERELFAKEKALEEANALVESTNTEVSKAQQRIEELEAAMAETMEKIHGLESEVQEAHTRATASADEQAQELQLQQDKLSARVADLEATMEAKTLELAALTSAKDEERIAAVAELMQQHAAELERTAALARGFQEQGKKAEAEQQQQQQLVTETVQLKTKIAELELAKAAAEHEANRLRVEVESLKAASVEAAATAVNSAATADSSQIQTLQESLEAKEAQIMRLLTELEGLSKHQLEDQRLVVELKEQLRQSERRVLDVEQSQSPLVVPPSTDSVDLHALHETIQVLRKRVVELESTQSDTQEHGHVGGESSEGDDVEKLNASRQQKRIQQQVDVEKTKRQQRVADFTEKARQVVQELQLGLEEYSSVFRDACALRDEAPSSNVTDTKAKVESEQNGDVTPTEQTEYEEYLTFNSGVVIKAGSTFSLPVYCEKPGWRVQWKFAVKEEGADVGYALYVVAKPQGEQQTIVTPARVHELSGVCDAPALSSDSPTTAVLQFEWDNTFSWLNEKTLDYHVSVLQPLSVEKKTLRARERELTANATTLEKRLELLSQEKERRVDLQRRLLLVEACEKEKDDQVSGLETRKGTIKVTKTQLQVHMEDLKHQLSALVSELDEIETHGRAVATAWETLQGELEDVDMTMRLSANSQLDELAVTLQPQLQRVGKELDAVQRELRSENA